MFNPSREQVRQFFCEAWRKHRQRCVVDGADAVAADLIANHPEYHALLENPDLALTEEFTPESGRMNPCLHLSLHLAVAEQISIDQPRGIRAAYQTLRGRLEVHDAEHALVECLGEALWHAQRQGGAIDQAAYIEAIRRAAST